MRCDPVIDPPRERCGNGTRIYSTYCYSGVGASAVPLDLCATFRFGFIVRWASRPDRGPRSSSDRSLPSPVVFSVESSVTTQSQTK